jgi:hypothetical protein
MREIIAWIAAVAEDDAEPGAEEVSHSIADELTTSPSKRGPLSDRVIESLPAHQFPPANEILPEEFIAEESPSEQEAPFEDPQGGTPSLRAYRRRTVAMLRRYLRYSLETGRLPSILGREFFRTTVTSYSVTTFEDRVVFAHDVEMCLRRLDHASQQIIARVILQEHSYESAARLLHCCRKTIQRNLWEAIDRLSEIFLELELLARFPSKEDR